MLIFEGGGVVEVVGSPRKQAYALIFESGRGGGVGKEQPSSKTSVSAHFRRWSLLVFGVGVSASCVVVAEIGGSLHSSVGSVGVVSSE
jgi:hypothetical protein